MAGCARLAVPDAAAGGPRPGRARSGRHQGHRDQQQRPRPHRHFRKRRDAGRSRRHPAARHRSRQRRHHPALCRAGGHARHQSGLVRVRPAQRHRQAGRALADRRPLCLLGLRRGVAGPRRAAPRARHAVGRLRAGARQERPRRRVPHLAGAGADRDVCRRACRRPADPPLSLEGRRVRAEEPRPPALQRHLAGHHRPARHLPDRRVRGQPQGHLPERRRLHLVRADVPVRGLRLLAQAVHHQAGGERRLSCRHRGRHGGEPAGVPAHLPAARRMARRHPHAHRAVDAGAVRPGGRGVHRSAAGGDLRPVVVGRHRAGRRPA